jgi:hypothetical protein
MDHLLNNPLRRLWAAAVIAALAVACGLGVAGLGGPGADHAAAHEHAAALTPRPATGKALRFHDEMRRLWEDHITWTRLTIISFAEGIPDLDFTLDRLLENQEDIGDAIKPFYGRKAGNELTALLKEHINGAVDLLAAAKSGDQGAFADAKAAWYENGRQVADFLHAANPESWTRREMRSLMRTHLDQTLKEGADRLASDYAADIRDYEAIHRHILMMADALSDGIIAQFPRRFA